MIGILLATLVVLYSLGLGRLWSRAGVGRGIGWLPLLCFLTAVGVLTVALLSPLEALSGLLFSAHMLQHLLLLLLAAPLLVLARLPLVLLWALPARWRRTVGGSWKRAEGARSVWRTVSGPTAVLLAYTAIVWAWHVPALYELAVRSPLVHALEHAGFLGAASLFWWLVLQPLGRRRLSPGFAPLYLFAASLQGSALGLLIALSPTPWYDSYAASTRALGRSLLADQQLAGLIMWMPVGIVYTLVAAILFGVWLRGLLSGGPPRQEPRVGQMHTATPEVLP